MSNFEIRGGEMHESERLILELRKTIAELSDTIAALNAQLDGQLNGQVDPLCFTQRELKDVQFRMHYEANNGNCTETAKSLGITRRNATLHRDRIGLPAHDKWGRVKQ